MDSVLFEIFSTETKQHIAVLKKHLLASEKEDLYANDALIKAIHTLYGSSQSADVPLVAQLSGELEKTAKLKKEHNLSYQKEELNLIAEFVEFVETVLVKIKSNSLAKLDNSLLLSKIVNSHNQLTQEIEGELSEQDFELIDIFLEEADEILEELDELLEAWQADFDNKKVIKSVQRQLHTLKGGARMAQFAAIGDLTHALEHLIVMALENKVEKSDDFFDLIQDSVDGLTIMQEQAKTRSKVSQIQWLLDDIEHFIGGAQLDEDELESVIEAVIDEIESKASEDTVYLENEVKKLETEEIVADIFSEIETKVEVESVLHGDTEHLEPTFDEPVKPILPTKESIRLKSETIDELINYAGEVNIYHSRLGQQFNDYRFNLGELGSTIVRLREQLRNMHSETEEQILYQVDQEGAEDENFDPLELDRYSHIQQLSKSLLESVGDLESIRNILGDLNKDSETLLNQQSRVGSDLQEGLMSTRMVTFSTVQGRLARIVRQTASEMNKKIDFKLIGGDTEVDRTMQDRIVAPIEHMLRNSIAHGIEQSSVRKEQNKPEKGSVTITLKQAGGDVLFDITDDGQGLNLDAIKEKAIKLKVISKKQKLAPNELAQLIFHSGLSTSESVSQVSGRGVGMDVVSNDIKQLGGTVSISTEKGKGTTFGIRLPLTLAISQALLVETGSDQYAVPIAGMVGVSLLGMDELKEAYTNDDRTLSYGDEEYKLQYLGSLMQSNSPDLAQSSGVFPVLFLRTGEYRIALHVDGLLGRREVVVKPVGVQVSNIPGITGATILANGDVMLILDIGGLYRHFSRAEIVANVAEYEDETSVEASSELTIMIVDDSITIRKVTQRMLERFKINVITAKDGIEAVALLNDIKPDLMLLDIEMPRMDGFEVASFVKNTPDLSDLPIVMITSRTGDKHRNRAMELGVAEYLGKPYQENQLMHTVAEILDSDELRNMIDG